MVHAYSQIANYIITTSRLMVVSRGAKKNRSRPTRRTSELFTGSTAVKLVNALNNPPLKLSHSYQ